MRRWLREPLLHFAVLGAALFAAYGLVRPASSSSTEIVVSAGQIDALTAQFSGTWQRAPSDEELRALVDNYVRDEVLFREGLALGLDRDDPVIRNRVKQKMEFLGEDTLAVEPTEAELAAYLESHRELFEIPAAITFEQVYFDPAKRGASLEGDIARARAALERGQRADAVGDQTLLAARMDGAAPSEVTAAFGAEFAKTVPTLTVGTWQGPVRSTYGMHVVRVVSRGTPEAPTLAEARNVVAREWTRARTLELKETFYAGLRGRYTVRVEPAAPSNARAGER